MRTARTDTLPSRNRKPPPPPAGQQQSRAQSEAEGVAEGKAYPAVTFCFGPTKGIVFIIAVIPNAAGTELAFTWREESGTLCRGSSAPYPWGRRVPTTSYLASPLG